jgi:predicted 3-demethylubiquinone-9 3-methyltransferase (glyoxalase superfamily)
MVQANGSAALEFNRSVFPDTKVEEIECYGPREAEPEGPVKLARFSISVSVFH